MAEGDTGGLGGLVAALRAPGDGGALKDALEALDSGVHALPQDLQRAVELYALNASQCCGPVPGLSPELQAGVAAYLQRYEDALQPQPFTQGLPELEQHQRALQARSEQQQQQQQQLEQQQLEQQQVEQQQLEQQQAPDQPQQETELPAPEQPLAQGADELAAAGSTSQAPAEDPAVAAAASSEPPAVDGAAAATAASTSERCGAEQPAPVAGSRAEPSWAGSQEGTFVVAETPEEELQRLASLQHADGPAAPAATFPARGVAADAWTGRASPGHSPPAASRGAPAAGELDVVPGGASLGGGEPPSPSQPQPMGQQPWLGEAGAAPRQQASHESQDPSQAAALLMGDDLHDDLHPQLPEPEPASAPQRKWATLKRVAFITLARRAMGKPAHGAPPGTGARRVRRGGRHRGSTGRAGVAALQTLMATTAVKPGAGAAAARPVGQGTVRQVVAAAVSASGKQVAIPRIVPATFRHANEEALRIVREPSSVQWPPEEPPHAGEQPPAPHPGTAAGSVEAAGSGAGAPAGELGGPAGGVGARTAGGSGTLAGGGSGGAVLHLAGSEFHPPLTQPLEGLEQLAAGGLLPEGLSQLSMMGEDALLRALEATQLQAGSQAGGLADGGAATGAGGGATDHMAALTALYTAAVGRPPAGAPRSPEQPAGAARARMGRRRAQEELVPQPPWLQSDDEDAAAPHPGAEGEAERRRQQQAAHQQAQHEAMARGSPRGGSAGSRKRGAGDGGLPPSPKRGRLAAALDVEQPSPQQQQQRQGSPPPRGRGALGGLAAMARGLAGGVSTDPVAASGGGSVASLAGWAAAGLAALAEQEEQLVLAASQGVEWLELEAGAAEAEGAADAAPAAADAAQAGRAVASAPAVRGQVYERFVTTTRQLDPSAKLAVLRAPRQQHEQHEQHQAQQGLLGCQQRQPLPAPAPPQAAPRGRPPRTAAQRAAIEAAMEEILSVLLSDSSVGEPEDADAGQEVTGRLAHGAGSAAGAAGGQQAQVPAPRAGSGGGLSRLRRAARGEVLPAIAEGAERSGSPSFAFGGAAAAGGHGGDSLLRFASGGHTSQRQSPGLPSLLGTTAASRPAARGGKPGGAAAASAAMATAATAAAMGAVAGVAASVGSRRQRHNAAQPPGAGAGGERGVGAAAPKRRRGAGEDAGSDRGGRGAGAAMPGVAFKSLAAVRGGSRSPSPARAAEGGGAAGEGTAEGGASTSSPRQASCPDGRGAQGAARLAGAGARRSPAPHALQRAGGGVPAAAGAGRAAAPPHAAEVMEAMFAKRSCAGSSPPGRASPPAPQAAPAAAAAAAGSERARARGQGGGAAGALQGPSGAAAAGGRPALANPWSAARQPARHLLRGGDIAADLFREIGGGGPRPGDGDGSGGDGGVSDDAGQVRRAAGAGRADQGLAGSAGG
ncbi:hypothetical protein HT031_006957 [Scenedesmus sp. PABB004]|nr:hypothetical protein HT031_006957 [Scenedesmus sp. PABB004]